VGSPLFAYHPLPACRGYAPRKHRSSLALAAAVILPSPQGTAGRLLHTCSISGLFLPFTDVPAYVLPVYASPCALPHPTQDSVPDCWLRFVRAAIADGWTICACKAQPPHNPARPRPPSSAHSGSQGCQRWVGPRGPTPRGGDRVTGYVSVPTCALCASAKRSDTRFSTSGNREVRTAIGSPSAARRKSP
jgi:hypothetical protein